MYPSAREGFTTQGAGGGAVPTKFHDEEEETKREPHRAFIPSGTDSFGWSEEGQRRDGGRAKPFGIPVQRWTWTLLVETQQAL